MFTSGDDQPHAVPQIPGFEDMRRIGSGGSAVVYRARQVMMDRPVAVKVFTERIHDAKARKQFEDECTALGALSRIDGIATIYLPGVTTDGRVYLVMALYEESLQNRLRPGGVPVPDIARVGGSVAATLHHIHVSGRIHGDITPSNILFTASGNAVLSDFGLSLARDSRGGQDAATWEHAAPELWQGSVLEPKTDVYGLGSTLYAAATGAPPLPRTPGESPALYGARVRNARPFSLDGSRLPGAMAAVVNAMLAERPEDRPDPLEVASALAEFAGPRAVSSGAPATPVPTSAPMTTRRPGVSETWSLAASPTPSTTVRPGTSEPGPDRLTSPRSTWWLVGGAVVLVAVVALGAVLLLNRDSEAPGTAGGPAPSSSTTRSTSVTSPPPEESPIRLDPPVDNGSTVDLSWTGPAGWEYGVVIAIEDDRGEPEVELVYDRTSYTVEVDPGSRYCFQVQGTPDARTAAVSDAVGIRDADCVTR